MELSAYLRILSRHRRYLGIGALLGLVVAGLLVATSSQVYESRARVFFTASTNQSDTEYQGRQFTASRTPTYAQLATSESVLDDVIDELELDLTADELAAQVTAVADPGTVLVTITAQNTEAKTARAIVRAITTRIVTLAPELEQTSGAEDPPVRATISTPATKAKVVRGTQAAQRLVLGLALGLFLGAAAAVTREILAPTVGLRDSLEQVTDVPVLGHVGPAEASRSGRSRRASAPDGAATVAATTLRHHAQHLTARSIGLTPVAPQDRSPAVASELAEALARLGESVVVVDAAAPSEQQPPGEVGLADVIQERATLEDALQHNGGAAQLGPGSSVGDRVSLIGSTACANVVSELTSRYCFVLVATPSIASDAGATLLNQQCDETVLLVRPGHTKSAHLRNAIAALSAVGITPVGMILSA